MQVEVLSGLPGCGKSYVMRQEAINNPGLYLFVYPTAALIKEQKAAFEADDTRGILSIAEAHSKAKGSGSVQDRLHRHQAYFSEKSISHAVVLLTHEGLMGADLSRFADWHVRIDEAPNTIQSGFVRAPASADLLKTLIEIEPFGPHGWGRLKLASEKIGWSALANDALLKPLAELMKQASRSDGVFVDTCEWKESFGWCSFWRLGSLAHCRSVKIAGASYPVSLGAIFAQKWEGIDLALNPTIRPREAQPAVHVHYFTQSHEGNTKLWEEWYGSKFIVQICDFLTKNEPNLGFWAANDVVEKLLRHRLNGKPIPPKAAGLNVYDNATSCAFIYSSKPLSNDKPGRELFSLTDKEIYRAREEEDILQFVMRGAIRRPDFGDDYDIYLYSKRQAELVQQKLIESGICKSVDLVPEPDAGIMDADPRPMKTVRDALKKKKSEENAKKRGDADAERKRNARAIEAQSANRPPSANAGRGGRPAGSKDKKPRAPRSKK